MGSSDRALKDLAAQVLRQPAAFDFFQAVRLLEEAHPSTVAVGTGSDPAYEALAFRSKIGFEFPVADLVAAFEGNRRLVLEVAFMGLAGSDGPLPVAYTEMVQDCARSDGGVAGIDPQPPHGPDDDARDFLDIFNHRLLSFFYRARKKHRVALGASGDAPFERMLFQLIGFNDGLIHAWLRRKGSSPGLPAVPSRSLLRYAGLLAGKTRSMAGLTTMLADAFGVPVTGTEHLGRWLPIAPRFQSALGPRLGKNRALGVDTVLGKRAWEVDGAAALALGPMPLDRFRALLPGGPEHEALVFLTRFYLRQDLDVQVTLLLAASEAELGELACLPFGELNRTAWIGPGRPEQPHSASFALPRWDGGEPEEQA
jgi:type VI secretion system protein ImpH